MRIWRSSRRGVWWDVFSGAKREVVVVVVEVDSGSRDIGSASASEVGCRCCSVSLVEVVIMISLVVVVGGGTSSIVSSIDRASGARWRAVGAGIVACVMAQQLSISNFFHAHMKID